MSFKKRNAAKGHDDGETQCNDCSRPATCRCVSCQWFFCDLCYETVHSVSKALLGHKRLSLLQASTSDRTPSVKKPLMCELHSRLIEYFCESDQVLVCSSCVIKGPHWGHTVTSLEEKNKLLTSDIESSLMVAKCIMEKLKDTEKVLQKITPNYDKDIMRLSEEVREDFLWFNGILQLREAALLKKIAQTYNESAKTVTNLRKQIIEQRIELQSTIIEGQKVFMGKDEQIDGKAVLEALREARDLPCTVVTLNDFKPNVKYSRATAIVQALRMHGDIECDSDTGMLLAPCTESEEELKAAFSKLGGSAGLYSDNEEDETAETESVTSTVSVASSILTEGASATGDEGRPGPLLPMPMVIPRAVATENKQNRTSGQVMVSHIKSPGDFMVHRSTDLKQLKSLQVAINSWCKNSRSNPIQASLKVGDAALCLYEGMWHRARIVGVKPGQSEAGVEGTLPAVTSDSRPTYTITTVDTTPTDIMTALEDRPSADPAIPSGTTFDVYYFDYGNYATVTEDKIHAMPPRYMKSPDFAMNCCLANIEPKKDVWSPEAIKQFAIMVSDMHMYMLVYNEHNHVLQVDLSRPTVDDVADNRPVSVRDTLVFLELASFVAKKAECVTASQPESRYIPKEVKGIGSRFKAIVSHNDGPDHIVVQETGKDMDYLSQLMMDLQDFYKDNYSKWIILCPQIGMPCVSQYSDRMWYRAEVIGLPGNKKVAVEYIDYGNRDVINASQLRKMEKRFILLPAQAIHCTLAHVAPLNEAGWSIKAIKRLSEMIIIEKTCSLTVLDTIDHRLMVKMVVLENDRQALHLNSLLVTEGLARSTGICSLETLPRGSVGRPLRVTQDKAYRNPVKNKGIIHTRQIKRAQADSSSRSPVHSRHSNADGATKPTCKALKPEVRTVEKKSDPSVMEVVVSKFYNPSKLFVQLASARESGLDRLMNELKQTFEKSEPNVTKVDVSQCFVVKCKDEKWYRAKVVKVISESTFEAHMLDYGCTETVALSDTRVMNKATIDIRCFAFQCALADISPAGGSPHWTKTSCESCLSMLKSYKYFIATKGNTVDGVLPIDLNMEIDIPETALEPARKDYFSLIGQLLENGLALPTSRARSVTSTKPDKVESATNYAPVIHLAAKFAASADASVISPTETVANSDIDAISGVSSSSSSGAPSSDLLDVTETLKTAQPEVGRIEVEGTEAEERNTENMNMPQRAEYVEKADSGEDTEEEIKETLPPVLLLSQRWTYLPRPHPQTSTFVAKAMFVDNNCVIYAQLLDQESVDALNALTEDMQQYYSTDSQYERPQKWSVGQACATYYEMDSLWCRTCVESVKDKELQVLYIDYGNSEMVLADNVQADVEPFTLTPQFTATFTLANVEPLNEYHGIWPENVLEFIQNQIVNYHCTVEVVEYLEDGKPFKANVYMVDGDCLGDMLCENGLAQRCDDMTSLVKRSKTIQDCIQSRQGIKYEQLPVQDYLFPITITHVELPNIVYFQHAVQEVMDSDDKHQKLFSDVNEHLHELENMSTKLNAYGQTARLMKQARAGMICCAQFSVDMCWYRGLIVAVNALKERALIYFLDYGNTQDVNLSQIRLLQKSFLHLPVQATCCHVAHLRPRGEAWTDAAYEAMVMASCNKTLLASITSRDPHVEANFYQNNKETGSMQHVYQQLLDDSLALAPGRSDPPDSMKAKAEKDASALATYMLHKKKPRASHSDSEGETGVRPDTGTEDETASEMDTASEAHTDSEELDDLDTTTVEGNVDAATDTPDRANVESKPRTRSWSEIMDQESGEETGMSGGVVDDVTGGAELEVEDVYDLD